MTKFTHSSKTILLSACLTGTAMSLPSAALAQTPDVLAKLYECKALKDNTARLTCYDAAAGRVEAAQQTGELVAIDREAAEEIQRDSFGFNIPSLPKISLFNRANKDKENSPIAKAEFEEVVFPIKSVRKMSNGNVKFYLENGQIWQQTQAKRVPKIRAGQSYTLQIKKAAMGSFMGRVDGKGSGIRIKRVQ